MELSRRHFIQKSSLGILACTVGPVLGFDMQNRKTPLSFPKDGDIFHISEGVVKNGLLRLDVDLSREITSGLQLNSHRLVTGKKGVRLNLKPGPNKLKITSANTEEFVIYYAPHLNKQYRISIDDAIWFLRDINQNKDHYSSIFQSPFLACFNELHKKHNVKLHINLFYETEGFNLSEMTDKFKQEWIANADWIRLSIHAKSEFPDNPYRNASYDDIRRDVLQVNKEIERFAGKELMSNETTLHWGEVPVEVSRGLRDAGYNIQVCDFNVDNDLPPCSYYLTVPQRRHMNKRFVWRDNEENITFVRSAIIVDTVKREKILPFLDDYTTRRLYLPYVDFLIHEQYFYSFYKNYQPDYASKLDLCIKWAIQNNYKPGFLSESLCW
ncbi:MAG: hypothetical protein ACTHLE_08585 [Agriterribacter sp.]